MYAFIIYKFLDNIYLASYNNIILTVYGHPHYAVGDYVYIEKDLADGLYKIQSKITNYKLLDVPSYIISDFDILPIRQLLNDNLKEIVSKQIRNTIWHHYDFLPLDNFNLNYLDVGHIAGYTYYGMSAGKAKFILSWFDNRKIEFFDTSLIITPIGIEALTKHKGEITQIKYQSLYPWEKDGFEDYTQYNSDPKDPIFNYINYDGYLANGFLQQCIEPKTNKPLLTQHISYKGEYSLLSTNFIIYKTLVQRVPFIEYLQKYIFYAKEDAPVWENNEDIVISDNTFWHPDYIAIHIQNILNNFNQRKKGFIYFNHDINEKLNNSLESSFELPEPPTTNIKYDSKKDEIEIHQGTAGIRTTDDGGIIIEDAYGSQIILSKGNIYLSAAGDIFLLPGRDQITMAGHYIVLKSNNHIEISSLSNNIYFRAKNLYAYIKDTIICELNEIKVKAKNISGYIDDLLLSIKNNILISDLKNISISVRNLYINGLSNILLKFQNTFLEISNSILAFSGNIIAKSINLIGGIVANGGIIARAFASPGKAFGKVGEAAPDVGQAKQLMNETIPKINQTNRSLFDDLKKEIPPKDNIKFVYDTKSPNDFKLREFKWQNMFGGKTINEEAVNDTLSYPGKNIIEKEGSFLTCENNINHYNYIEWDRLQEKKKWTLKTIKKTLKNWIVTKL